MNDIVISLQDVSKSFQRYGKPADRLKELLIPGRRRKNSDVFWAVKNLSLEVSRGQTLGIVGRNGSGKSTTLQMVVGTLQPTSGSVSVKGRISALLELGSGFNPEFTGRQNVFFNAQMLGLSRSEVEEKFDQIAGFADIGSFLDEPVKTYSSGMFVRLAFSVAIHSDPDILVVDEALSVGDEAFQRKCFARIHAVRDAGGTILFVSHGASTIIELCDRAIFLDQGELLLDGNPKLVVDKYQKLSYAPPQKAQELREEIKRLNGSEMNTFSHKELTIIESMAATPELLQPVAPRSPQKRQIKERLKAYFDPQMKPHATTAYVSRGVKIQNPQITTLTGEVVNYLVGRDEYLYTYTAEFERDVTQVRFGMLIKTVSGLELGGASLVGRAYSVDMIKAGSIAKVKFRFKCLLNSGAYFMNAGVSGTVDGHFGYLDRWIDAAMFKVQVEDFSHASGIVDWVVDPDLTIYDGPYSMTSTSVSVLDSDDQIQVSGPENLE